MVEMEKGRMCMDMIAKVVCQNGNYGTKWDETGLDGIGWGVYTRRESSDRRLNSYAANFCVTQ